VRCAWLSHSHFPHRVHENGAAFCMDLDRLPRGRIVTVRRWIEPLLSVSNTRVPAACVDPGLLARRLAAGPSPTDRLPCEYAFSAYLVLSGGRGRNCEWSCAASALHRSRSDRLGFHFSAAHDRHITSSAL